MYVFIGRCLLETIDQSILCELINIVKKIACVFGFYLFQSPHEWQVGIGVRCCHNEKNDHNELLIRKTEVKSLFYLVTGVFLGCVAF